MKSQDRTERGRKEITLQRKKCSPPSERLGASLYCNSCTLQLAHYTWPSTRKDVEKLLKFERIILRKFCTNVINDSERFQNQTGRRPRSIKPSVRRFLVRKRLGKAKGSSSLYDVRYGPCIHDYLYSFGSFCSAYFFRSSPNSENFQAIYFPLTKIFFFRVFAKFSV